MAGHGVCREPHRTLGVCPCAGVYGGPFMAVVLIVEDEIPLLILAESDLQAAGYETVSAASVAEALAVINDAEQKIDLLLTDLGLGDEPDGGLEIGQAAAKSRPGLPVVYTTGRGVTDGMIKLFVEPNRFLSKPYTREQLFTAVADALRSTST
jgi:DNA-binding NtrC family response regulator